MRARADLKFAALPVAVLLVMILARGTLVPDLLAAVLGVPSPTAVVVADPAPVLPPAVGPLVGPPGTTPALRDPSPSTAPPSTDDPPLEVSPPRPEEPLVPCPIGALTDVLGELRGGLAGLLGRPLPGETLTALAELATGCGGHDPVTVLLDVALDLATIVPDLGLDPVDIPDLPPLLDLTPLQPLAALLGPAAEPLAQGCAQLALVTLLFVALPSALHLPITAGDLIQALRPAQELCAFIEAARATG